MERPPGLHAGSAITLVYGSDYGSVGITGFPTLDGSTLGTVVGGYTYNVAGGRTVEMREVLELLLGLADARIEVEPDPALARPADLPVVCGDATRLRDTTGWVPTIPLEQTLADTLDAARRATTRMASA